MQNEDFYIERDIEPILIQASKEFKTVSVVGPSQCGKTSLVRHVFPKYNYVNLERTIDYNLAKYDINAFFKRYKSPLIIDEVQRVPELLNKIQYIVDNNEGYGQFIFTGSFQQGLSQSLAGRMAILNLLPLSISELKKAGINLSRDELLSKGFMPKVYKKEKNLSLFYESYLQTYIERDVQNLLHIREKRNFEKFIALLAGRTGCLLNVEQIASDSAISKETVNSWLSVLENSYIIFFLQPYYKNFSKRIIKSPKLYWTEPGLVSYLLNISRAEEVARDPLLGALFENMVMNEIFKTEINMGRRKNLYFLRDSKNFEVDCLIGKKHNKLSLIEVKAGSSICKDFELNLRSFYKNTLVKNKKSDEYKDSPLDVELSIVYSGDLDCNVKINDEKTIRYVSFNNIASLLE